MARDRFERTIDYLRLSVTDRCDLGCMYCGPGRDDGRRPEPMTPEETVRIAQAAVALGLRQIRLTGGEPLMRPDIVELVSAVSSTGVRDLSLTTNGQKLAGLARKLKSAGLRRLNISLDSLRPERYAEMTGGGDFQRAISGIREAEAAGLEPVKINMVPIRDVNHDEIPDFARMTLERPVHVRFIEYMPAGRPGQWGRGKCVTSDETRSIVEEALGPLYKRRFRGRGPSRNYQLENAPGIIGFISALSHSFCYNCSRLRVTSRGTIRPCLFSSTEIDLLGPMRRGADDSEIRRLLTLAVEAKPEGNYLSDPESIASIDMSRIGG